MESGALVAVDLGLKTGFAVYAADGRLQSYRSQNYGTRERLKRGAESALGAVPDLRWMAVEGDTALGRPTSLRHDAAEAILAGLWACLHFGLLTQLPPPLQLERRG